MPSASHTAAALKTASSRDEGYALLDGLSKQQLLAVADELRVACYANDNKAAIARRIVEGAVGARVDAAAIRSSQWER